MQGRHLTADLYRCRCDPAWLADAQRLAPWCAQAFEVTGLGRPACCSHGAAPDPAGPVGVSVSLLAPGVHACLHAWAADRSATLDVYVAGVGPQETMRARQLMDALVAQLAPEWTEQRSLDRGDGE